jgi:cell division septation protein DedD
LLVGAFASKEGARQLQDELNARGISNQVVVR